jgi:hypothetical protein
VWRSCSVPTLGPRALAPLANAQQNLAFLPPAPERSSDFRLARRFHKTSIFEFKIIVSD